MWNKYYVNKVTESFLGEIMKNLISRFIHEEDAALDAWVCVIIFLLITIACYIIVWQNWGKAAIKRSVEAVDNNMREIISHAEAEATTAGTDLEP